MNAAIAMRRLMLAGLALACLGADEFRLAPRFEGKSIPDPPRQREPWTPPPTKLPRFLVAATATLFEQGVADPRGCEYREIEVGDESIVKTHGFVLPRREGEADRFAVGWDGVIYPAISVGAAADLEKDIRALADSLRRERQAEAAGPSKALPRRGYWWSGTPGRGPSSVENGSPLKLGLLLRLGRADLAELLMASATPWDPAGAGGRDRTDYQVNYLILAQQWAAAVYSRLISAHMRGEDVIALDAARRLSAFAKAVAKSAAELGFELSRCRYGEAPSYLPLIGQVSELLADQERRAKEPTRTPIPIRAGDPSKRIAAMIRDLDQIAERQTSSPGIARPGNSPLVKALIAEGEAAVEPLLAAFETDMRLTRSVTFGYGASYVHPVAEAEVAALSGLLPGADFRNTFSILRDANPAGRKELVRSLRAFWRQNRAVSPNERWYRVLRDDAAGRDRWMEAAANLVYPSDWPGPAVANGHHVRSLPPRLPMKGEDLRSRRDPSVSDLMVRRIRQIARAGNFLSHDNIELYRACELATMLYRWDEPAAVPILRTLMNLCREDMQAKRDAGTQLDQTLGGYVAWFAMVRARSGRREALDEYAAWIRTCHPKELERQSLDVFEPLWTYPDHPAIREAARWLFNDPGSPWVPLLRSPGGPTPFFYDGSLVSSPMVRVSGFRDGLVAAMADRSVIGTVSRGEKGAIEYRPKEGGQVGAAPLNADLEGLGPVLDRPYRVCDEIARQVSAVEGAPRIELYWPEDRRDRAIEACAAFLRKYGERFTAATPDGQLDPITPNRKRAHLGFPILARPASRDDARDARAIFAIEGEGEVRLSKVHALPFRARWTTLKDTPVDYTNAADGTVHREYDQEGWIWQAEEVRRGDRWERYFGFVGRHTIARVPASEVELSEGRFSSSWGRLASGLDARIDAAEPHPNGYAPGQPVLAVVRIRNRRGVDGSAPTEFLRRGEDGRPSLRRGLSIAAFYDAPRPARSGQGQQGVPGDALKPKREDRFGPGPDSRPLAPFEAFEAMRIDLGDWFDLTRTGSYRVQISFAADSGAGEGTSKDWHFTVGGRVEALP